MNFNVCATLFDGTMVFNGTLPYIPHKEEEIEINGYVFVVKSVRYVFENGFCKEICAKLLLEQVK